MSSGAARRCLRVMRVGGVQYVCNAADGHGGACQTEAMAPAPPKLVTLVEALVPFAKHDSTCARFGNMLGRRRPLQLTVPKCSCGLQNVFDALDKELP